MSFWNRTARVRSMIDDYFAVCDECMARFQEAFSVYTEQGTGDDFHRAVLVVEDVESRADDLRRGIELTLYGKALLPESRGDILGLLESFDHLPNTSESVLQTIESQSIVLPEQLMPGFSELVRLSRSTYDPVRGAVGALLDNPRTTLYATKNVEDRESESDRAEQELVSLIFRTELDMGTKVMLKDLVFLIGRISDWAETTADRIGIVAIKRQI